MRNSVRPSLFAIMVCLTILSAHLAGCGDGGSDGLPREAISGTVTLDDQPLPDGVIQMLPISMKDGIAGGAIIKDGKYAIERDKGLVPGQYRVVINGGQAGGAAPPPDKPPGTFKSPVVPKDPIPSRYNSESTLTADVKAGSSNSFVFDLKAK